MYKFKSRVTGDLIMLEPNGRQILKILDRTDAESLRQGILLPAQMPAAIAALEAAVALDDADRKLREQEAQENGARPAYSDAISLHQRATPFIAMIKRCHKADKEIVWGV